MKPTIAIDFDGTICEQGPFFLGDIPYPPEPFAKEALTELSKYFTLVVFSVRALKPEGITAIAEWMKKYNIPYSKITAEKVAAMFYIDNRAIRYTGDWTEVLKQIATLEVV